ncbi:hypothetical protein BKH43_07945 [Helicobacter sp. 13S00401-1]|uniref:hypothetical protein n=1 Tax=Helicobacter sp. 13S00401-1 TaxID=1905758 RepID=UPI000BA6A576|nr:hypothetical protein [Helicobacter sp. 13S00401-1]PAF48208.1 hypothetical protein BKH43_07945 [Helicobacter sp. 13S00401-1]
MQNLENIVDKISTISAQSSVLTQVASSNLGTINNEVTRSIRDLGLQLPNLSSKRGYTALEMTGMLTTPLYAGSLKSYDGANTDLFTLSNSLNTLVNGPTKADGTSDITQSGGNNLNNISSASLQQAINQVNSQIQAVTLNLGVYANNSSMAPVIAEQQAAYSALATTLKTLQNAVVTNSNNVAQLSHVKLGNIFYSGDGVTNVNDITKLNSISGNNGDRELLLRVNQRNLVPALQSAIAAQNSTQTIDGIINGNADGQAVKTNITPNYTLNTYPINNGANTTTTTTVAPQLGATQSAIDAGAKIDTPQVINDNNGRPVKSLKQAVKDVQAANAKVEQTLAVVLATQNQAVGAAAREGARRNSAPTILPTAKAGLIAFFGKHQSVSVEYQYYFRNTNPSFTSGEVTLNYAYYFGGK